jgi:ElaB/YqjD/DUF883 family membrane-anchored ribosome-binding protein
MDATPTPPPPTTAEEPLKEFTERLAPKLEEVQAQLSQTNEKVKKFIRENPGTCVLGAVAVGFLVGKWASRR